jgi:hypothetical protein
VGRGQSHYLARLAVGLNERGNPQRVRKTYSVRANSNKTAARRAAEDWLSEPRRRKEAGQALKEDTLTLRQFAQRHIAYHYQEGRANNHWKPKYHHEFSKFVERFVYPTWAMSP